MYTQQQFCSSAKNYQSHSTLFEAQKTNKVFPLSLILSFVSLFMECQDSAFFISFSYNWHQVLQGRPLWLHFSQVDPISVTVSLLYFQLLNVYARPLLLSLPDLTVGACCFSFSYRSSLETSIGVVSYKALKLLLTAQTTKMPRTAVLLCTN